MTWQKKSNNILTTSSGGPHTRIHNSLLLLLLCTTLLSSGKPAVRSTPFTPSPSRPGARLGNQERGPRGCKAATLKHQGVRTEQNACFHTARSSGVPHHAPNSVQSWKKRESCGHGCESQETAYARPAVFALYCDSPVTATQARRISPGRPVGLKITTREYFTFIKQNRNKYHLPLHATPALLLSTALGVPSRNLASPPPRSFEKRQASHSESWQNS